MGSAGVGWPSIRAGFSIPLDAIGLFLTTVVAGYTTSSFLSGFLLARMGVGRMLAASCFLTGFALIGWQVNALTLWLSFASWAITYRDILQSINVPSSPVQIRVSVAILKTMSLSEPAMA